ncbi:MAG: nitroreductase family protein [bacterium]
MDLSKAIKNRRSVRKFTDQKVSKDTILKIIDAARWAPSACNRQLWEFIIVTKPEIKKRIAEEACFKQKFLIQAPVLIVVFYDDTKERREEKGPSKHDSIQSAAAAIQNMHLKAYSLGLGSVWVCAIKKMLKLNEILKVPVSIRPIAIVALGYPAEHPPVPKRRVVESFIHYERFQGIKESYPNSIYPRDWSLKDLTYFREKICWYGGSISPDMILEHFTMKSRTYKYIMSLVEKYYILGNKVLDILPFAGGYLIGLCKIIEDKSKIFYFELGEGNVQFIRENLKKFGVREPVFFVDSSGKLDNISEKINLITCFFRLERVPEPQQLLRQMVTLIQKGGKIILATELKGITWLGRDFFKRKNLHVSNKWCTGPSVKINKRTLNRWIKKQNCRIVEQRIYHENNIIKSIAKQIIKSKGPSLLTVIEKSK